MATRRMLLNDYCVTGHDLKSFTKNVSHMADSTEVLAVKGTEVTLLSLCEIEKFQTEGLSVFYILNEENVIDYLDFGERLRFGSIENEEFGEELLEELKNSTKLVAVVENEKYLISRSALATLSQRAGVSGDMTLNRNNLARDLHIADSLFMKNEWINFVYRRCDGVNKIFAAFSSEFTLNRQDIIIKALAHDDFPFKEFAVRNYSIDNSITELFLDLPGGTTDITPGLEIRNSDIGESSLIVRIIFRLGGSYAITSEAALRHDRSFTFERFMEETLTDAKEAFDKSTFAKDMEELKNLSIMDYSGFNSFSEADRENNFSAAEEILTEGVYPLYRKALSKKSYKNVCRFVIDEIDAGKKYTFFDMAKILLSVPEYLAELDISTLTNLRKAASEIPQFLKKKWSKKFGKSTGIKESTENAESVENAKIA